jgi:YggT family protein
LATAILYVINGLLTLFSFLIIAWAIISWLVAFNVINEREPIVRQIMRFLDAVTRPILWPVQRIIPTLGGVDLSPVIVLLIIGGIKVGIMPLLASALIPILG